MKKQESIENIVSEEDSKKPGLFKLFGKKAKETYESVKKYVTKETSTVTKNAQENLSVARDYIAKEAAQISEKTKKTVEKVTDSKLVSFIVGVTAGVVGNKAYDAISNNWDKIVETVQTKGTDIANFSMNVVSSVGNGISDAYYAIAGASNAVIGDIATGIMNNYHATEAWISGTTQAVGSVAVDAYQGIDLIAQNVYNAATSEEAGYVILGSAITAASMYLGSRICKNKESKEDKKKIQELNSRIDNLETKLESTTEQPVTLTQIDTIKTNDSNIEDYVAPERETYQSRFNTTLLINGENKESFSKKLAEMYSSGMSKDDIRNKIMTTQNMHICKKTMDKYAEIGMQYIQN